MGKRRDKKAQFYLIAAVIIVVVLSGLAFVANYSNLREDQIDQFYIKEELSIEGEKVVDYAFSNNLTPNPFLVNFTRAYSNYSEKGDDFYFIFGNRDLVTVAGYKKKSDGIFFFDSGKGVGKQQLNLVQGVYSSWNFTKPKSIVKTTIDGIEYPFMLTPGENFYFIVSKDINDEKYIFSSYSNIS